MALLFGKAFLLALLLTQVLTLYEGNSAVKLLTD